MATLYAVGNLDDPHITTVLKYVRELGLEAVAVPSWTPDARLFLEASWRWDAGWSLATESAIWLRNKHSVQRVATASDQEEWWSLANTLSFFSAAGALSPLLFNRITKAAASDAKIPQLHTALAAGFVIPPTLVSNKKAEIADFITEQGECAVKPLVSTSMPPINGDIGTTRFLPTVAVSARNISEADELSLRSAHNIYQKKIDKAYELRTIAFGSEIVSFKIDSQSHAFTQMDWRAGERLLGCEMTETPSSIIEPIRRFLSITGLDSSVFDFAVTPEGKVIFFESNPSGQWRRMDELNGDVVSKMFARQMVTAIADFYAPKISTAQLTKTTVDLAN